MPRITFDGVATALVENSTCDNAWDIWDATQRQSSVDDYPQYDTGLGDCGNSNWLTPPVNGAAGDPKGDGKCA